MQKIGACGRVACLRMCVFFCVIHCKDEKSYSPLQIEGVVSFRLFLM